MMMPEGPEVRTLVDQLQPAVGKRLVSFKILSGRYERESPRGLTEFWNTTTPVNDPDTMMVDIVKQLSCKGKFIYIVLDSGKHPRENGDFLRSIWITLGMTGYFMNDTVGEYSHMRWYMEFIEGLTQNRSGRINPRRIYFQDPRGFGTIRFSLSRQELMEKLASLGPDMLDEVFAKEIFLKILASKRPELNICKFLMDQSVCEKNVNIHILSDGSCQ
jgi:formamidopyrimidine-DNA glycosylase